MQPNKVQEYVQRLENLNRFIASMILELNRSMDQLEQSLQQNKSQLRNKIA